MDENWTQWKPINELGKKYNIDEVIDNGASLTVILSNARTRTNKKVKIHFENCAQAYHSANETLRCHIIFELDKKYGLDFYGDWTFFKIANSRYLKWLSEQSCTISDDMPLIHFSILAANTILDIAALSEPKVEYINE